MTREEDKAILEHMQYELSNQTGSNYCRRKYEAVTRAIKAIECEPCEDCIDRQEVKRFVEYIQTIKDNHVEKGSPINYGTICDIAIYGHRLLDSPYVTPTHSTCKDCKHNKNGVCPNYRHFVDDDFYCANYEKRGDAE